MRRLITYLNSLLLGVILGMAFVAIVHPSTRRHEAPDTNGILISYQLLGTNQQQTVLLIAGRMMQLTDWPHGHCDRQVRRDYRMSSPVIAISVSPVKAAGLRQACALRK